MIVLDVAEQTNLADIHKRYRDLNQKLNESTSEGICEEIDQDYEDEKRLRIQ